MSESPLVMYLFGERDPEVAALLGERSFQRVVGELFQDGEPALPPGPPAFWDDAVRLDLLASDGKAYRAGRRLVLIPAAAERAALDLLRPALERYAGIAGEAAVDLRAVYGQTAAARCFAWHQVSHAVLAGLLLDLAVGREALRSGRIARRLTGDPVIWAFQGVSADNAYGVSLIPADAPRQACFAELWHRRARQTAPRLSPALVAVLAAVARGEQAGSPEELLFLRYLKLVRKAGGSLRLAVPVFAGSDAERLRVSLDAGARRLVADAVVPALELLEGDPWWREGVRCEACRHRHAAIRLILEYGIDRVISAGVCDPFPGGPDLPVEWGRWLWEEPEGSLLT